MSDMKRSLLQTLSEAGLVRRGILAHKIGPLRNGRDGVLQALSKVPVRPCPPVLVAALLVGALFPQLAKASLRQRRTLFYVKDAETSREVQVRMSKGNVCADSSTLSSPLFMYQELYKTTARNLYVRDVTQVPPLAVALFAGRLTIAPEEEEHEAANMSVMVVDDWLKLEMSRSTCDLLLQLRRCLDALWYQWMQREGEDEARHHVLVEQGGSNLLTYILASLNAQEEISQEAAASE